jgi:hypothetical protein
MFQVTEFVPRRSARLRALRIQNLTPLQEENEMRQLKLESYKSMREAHVELNHTTKALRGFLKQKVIQNTKFATYIELLDKVWTAWVNYHIFARYSITKLDKTALGQPVPCVEFMHALSKRKKVLLQMLEHDTDTHYIIREIYVPYCNNMITDIQKRSQ